MKLGSLILFKAIRLYLNLANKAVKINIYLPLLFTMPLFG
ncbi:hypothetical protein PPHE_a0467 [Pseudoalteromonas phenolica O-BC30]|nr:hypothetical protein [Pseudoalteromonas phenolica O-BC30]